MNSNNPPTPASATPPSSSGEASRLEAIIQREIQAATIAISRALIAAALIERKGKGAADADDIRRDAKLIVEHLTDGL